MSSLATPTHRTIHVNGIALHVALAGSEEAPLVILLHGFPEYWGAWRKQIEPLVDAGFRVAIPDQRGYGSSDKPGSISAYVLDTLADDIRELAQHLQAPRFSLVGHDWGGMVAWHLAARDKTAVDRLVILNAPHPASMFLYTLSHPLQILRSSYIGFFQVPFVAEAALAARNFALLEAALTRSARPHTFKDAELRAYREAWAQPGAVAAMLRWYRALPLARPQQGLIDAKVRIIWGEADAALEAGLATAALPFCRDADIVRLAKATHWLHHEEPARVNAALIEFLSPAS